jgi:hypothetical protein
VTEDLDEGPIIDQSIERVDHTQTPEKLAAVGRDVESLVLARGVRAVLEDRVLLNGHRTIVFNEILKETCAFILADVQSMNMPRVFQRHRLIADVFEVYRNQ